MTKTYFFASRPVKQKKIKKKCIGQYDYPIQTISNFQNQQLKPKLSQFHL